MRLADLAPLNAPLVEIIAQLQDEKSLLENVTEKRTAIYTYMYPSVKAELSAQKELYELQARLKRAKSVKSPKENIALLKKKISSYQEYRITRDWLLRSLKMCAKQPIPPQTLHNWTTRNIVHSREWGHPELQSSARLLIYAMSVMEATGAKSLDDMRKRWRPTQVAPYWIPSEIESSEPECWIWMQTDPDEEPCEIALPSEGEYQQGAFYWSQWPGLGWLPGWREVGAFGAARWGGQLTREDIRRWYPALPQVKFPYRWGGKWGNRELETNQINTSSEEALYFLAKERLANEEEDAESLHT
jgi:hypothetical protein